MATPTIKEAREDLTCVILETTEEYLSLQNELGALFQQGHMDIARAKYSMPPGSIDPHTFGPEEAASLRVLHSSDTSTSRQDQGTHCLDGSTSTSNGGSSSCGQSVAYQLVLDGTGACTSSSASSGGDAAQGMGGRTSVDHDRGGGRAKAGADPLRRFGALPPQSLRHAQERFREVTGKAAQLAAVAHRLQGLLQGAEGVAVPDEAGSSESAQL